MDVLENSLVPSYLLSVYMQFLVWGTSIFMSVSFKNSVPTFLRESVLYVEHLFLWIAME